MTRLTRAIVGVGGWAVLVGLAESPQPAHVQVELVSSVRTIQSGHPLQVAIVMRMDEGWHTYWKNPGDAGLPTTVRWELPERFVAGPMQWPVPQRIETGTLVSYGYEGEALLPVEISVPTDVPDGFPVTLQGRLDWVVCRELCLKEGADVQLELPVSDQAPTADPKWGARIAAARAALPVAESRWDVRAHRKGGRIEVRFIASSRKVEPASNIQFFPEEQGVIEHGARQLLKHMRAGYLLQLELSPFAKAPPTRLRGVAVCANGWSGPGSPRAIQVDVPIQ